LKNSVNEISETYHDNTSEQDPKFA